MMHVYDFLEFLGKWFLPPVFYISLRSFSPSGLLSRKFGPTFDPLDIWGDQRKAQGRAEAQSIADAQAEEARREDLRRRINELYGIGPDTEAANLSRAGLAQEETGIATSLRGHYGDEAEKAFEKAERELRFAAARSGNLGSPYAESRSELEEQNRVGGTRIEDAVQRALNSLRASREQSRLGSINLVNAGQGEEGVRSASAGLQSSLQASQAARREDLFTDLFANVASGWQVANARNREAELLAALRRGQQGGGSVGQPSRGSGATVIQT